MRVFITALLVVGFFLIAKEEVSAQAQSRFVRNYNSSITANPIGLAFGVINATYENQIAEKNSYTLFANFWSFGGWSAFGVGGSYRWYYPIDDELPITGLGFGPVAALEFWDYDGAIYNGGMTIAIGGEAAYKLVLDGGFTIEPIFRLAINVIGIKGLSYRPYSLGVNLGYSW
jgi:hypothetical protein